MKASEALSLGRTITDNPERGNINSCALGMMLNALGVPPLVEWRTFNNERKVAIIKAYPWMKDTPSSDFLTKYQSYYTDSYGNWIADTFNKHVMAGTMTLDQLHDIIAEVEPACGICNKFDCSCHEVDTAVQSLVQERSGHVEEAFKNMEMAK